MFKAMDPLESDERMVGASSKLVVLDKLLTKLKVHPLPSDEERFSGVLPVSRGHNLALTVSDVP